MLLSNPVGSPMWPMLGWTFVAIFGGSFAALLIAVRGRWRKLARSVLFERWRTWLIIAPVFSACALGGPLSTAVLAAALGLVASREYASLVSLPLVDRAVLATAAIVLPFVAVFSEPWRLAVALPLAASLPALMSQDIETGARRLAALAFGLFYIPLALALLVTLDTSPGVLLALALATALSDVGAFTAGNLFGHRKLAERLSPSKTLAGAGGNLLGAALGLLLLRPLAPEAPLLLLAPLVGVGAIWGDLLESLLKRSVGAKDAGACLPGFGGVLDRIDSLLVVLPLAALALGVTA